VTRSCEYDNKHRVSYIDQNRVRPIQLHSLWPGGVNCVHLKTRQRTCLLPISCEYSGKTNSPSSALSAIELPAFSALLAVLRSTQRQTKPTRWRRACPATPAASFVPLFNHSQQTAPTAEFITGCENTDRLFCRYIGDFRAAYGMTSKEKPPSSTQ
jgi:hypothetical protein